MPNFFELYAEYVKKTEPPPNFHAWSAISSISALLGKKVHIPQGHFTVHPNLYIVLVGDPGMRKSTAMNIAKRLTKLVETVPIAPESSTREALIDEMAKNRVNVDGKGGSPYWQSSAFVTEMGEFLGGKHINQAMVGFLTAIWDEPLFKERTRKGGEVVIHNPYFSMLGCCTPDWMNNKLKQDVITDGFSRRTIFALETELACLNPWPESGPEQLEILQVLANEARRIHAICGPFLLTEEARVYYDAKYYKTREEAKDYPEKVQNYFTSKHILALKIAMCISAGIDSMRIIDSNIIKTAFACLSQSERALAQVFSGVGRNELKSYADKMLRRISLAKGGMTKAEVVASSFDEMNMAEINDAFSYLIDSGLITSSGHVQEAPHWRAVRTIELAPAVNLIELMRRLVVNRGEKPVESSAFQTANHLDPMTSLLLETEKEWRSRTSSGILRKGKPAQVPDGKQKSSGSLEVSPSPQTPPPAGLSNPPSTDDSASLR